MSHAWARPVDIYLKVGEACLEQGTRRRVITVLGSCVAVVLYSPSHALSTICHALMPSARAGTEDLDARYVDSAIAMMLEFLRHEGVPLRSLQAKVFGGARLLASDDSALSVGRQNVIIARDVLERLGIAVVAEDVGGQTGRRICLYPGTGEVRLYRL
jgi:chemotaxis protein CheD